MELTDKNTFRRAIPNRPDDANKGTIGTLLSICGCYGMAGAAMLEAKAALRTGIGLHKCALPKSIYPIVAMKIPESVYLPLDETPDGKLSADCIDKLLEEAKRCSAVVIGCGLSVCNDTKQIVNSFIEYCGNPVLLDADALNCIADDPEILKKAKADIVITPHPGEFARLIKSTPAEVNADRENLAARFAERYGVTTVLKGAETAAWRQAEAETFSRVSRARCSLRVQSRLTRQRRRYIFTDLRATSRLKSWEKSLCSRRT